jgi:thioredoxin 1
MDFESHIQGIKPVLVEYYADWSEACKLLIPVVHELKATAGDRITVLRINIEQDPTFAKDYHVYTVPTLILFKEGKIIWRKNGMSSYHEIVENMELVMGGLVQS